MKPFYYILAVIFVLTVIFAACSGGGGGGTPSPSIINSWSFVDGNGTNGINKDAAQNAYSPQLSVMGSKLYAIWNEGSTASQIRVAVYNGIDTSPSWTFVDGNGTNGINKDATKNAFSQQLTLFGSKLYATWTEPTGTVSQIRVAVYNGNDLSPAWAFVDGNGTNGINKDVTRSASSPQLTVSGGKLYAAWVEPNATVNQVRVAVYSGNDASPTWTFVDKGANGINKDAARAAYSPQLTVMGSKLYAIWYESNGIAGQVRVAVYNGNDSSPTWNFVDGNGMNGINWNAAEKTYAPQLSACNGALYATWDESNRVRVALYNGDDLSPMWTFVDGNGTKGMNRDASKSAYNSQLTALGTKLYTTWQEEGQVRVVVGK